MTVFHYFNSKSLGRKTTLAYLKSVSPLNLFRNWKTVLSHLVCGQGRFLKTDIYCSIHKREDLFEEELIGALSSGERKEDCINMYSYPSPKEMVRV